MSFQSGNDFKLYSSLFFSVISNQSTGFTPLCSQSANSSQRTFKKVNKTDETKLSCSSEQEGRWVNRKRRAAVCKSRHEKEAKPLYASEAGLLVDGRMCCHDDRPRQQKNRGIQRKDLMAVPAAIPASSPMAMFSITPSKGSLWTITWWLPGTPVQKIIWLNLIKNVLILQCSQCRAKKWSLSRMVL